MHLSLADTISIAKELSISVDIDEHNITLCDSIVGSIMKVLFESLSPSSNTRSKPLAELKKTQLPLQNNGWAEWAEANRASNNFELENSDNFADFKHLRNRKMEQARLKQIGQLENPSVLLRKIINHCRSYGTLYEEFYIIWIILQNEFNSLSRQYLPPLYEEYKRWHTLSCSSEAEAVSSEDLLKEKQNTCKYSLIQAGKNIFESSLGIEHIFRELGQVFEAYKHLNDTPRKENLTRLFKFNIKNLADIAAKLLYEGHAFEIMDGDVSHVPITWVRRVLKSLDLTIGPDKRIFVLSILGTQSSGKSTLLNTMFGANFPVSSGRCTRGVFMQLIPIDDKLCSQFRYDYLVLLDTEGLRAPEFSINSSYKRDNELATFAVGLADMTIINMFGEGHSEVQDILQIIVFALIRMKEVSCKPRCVFVHQNVPDTHAHTNLVAARSSLIKTLDQMTISAAHQENKSSLYKKFFQVIEFDPEREVFYFPGLFEGEPPLQQIAPGYSKAAIKLYTYILNSYAKNSEKKFQTVMEWSKKLKTLWKSVLKENFIFSYRNALEVTTRIELDHKLSFWYSKYIYKMNDWKSTSVNDLLNASPNELDEIIEKLDEKLRREEISPSLELELEQKIMKYFFVTHEYVGILIQWKTNATIYFATKREKLIKALKNDYQVIYNLQKNKKEVDQKFNKYRKEIVKDVYTLFLDLKKEGLSLKDNTCFETNFQSLWNRWKSQIEIENIPSFDVNKDLQRAIIESSIMKQMYVFSTKADLISDASRYETIGKQDFQRLSDLKSPKHYNSHYYSLVDVEKKNIVRAFISSIFGKSKEKGAKQFLNSLGILSEECERNTQEYLSDHIHKQCPYDPNSFFVVIKDCFEVLNSFNTKQKKNIKQSLELTTDFFFDFIFHQCCKSIPFFQQIQDTFISRTSLDSKFSDLETQLKNNFLKLCDGIESEYLSATQLAKITINGMKDYLRDSVVNNFRSQFENDPTHAATYQSRSLLILRILKDLARARNFEDYISYIANPFNFIKTFVQKQFENYAGEKEVFERAVNQLLTDIDLLIQFYIKASNESIPTLWLHNISKFKISFHSRIKKKIRNVSLQDLDVLCLHPISNYAQFCDLYSQELKKGVDDTNWSEWLKNILSEEKTIYKTITDNLLECEALCPFCNEPCQLAVGEHEHYCGTFHRPQGLNGWRHIISSEISLKECTTSIQNKGSFFYKGISYKYEEYRTVNEEFNSWKILGEDAIDSKYWQWVLFIFEDKFLEYYEVVKNESIDRWSELTESEVVSDLESHYDSFIFKKY